MHYLFYIIAGLAVSIYAKIVAAKSDYIIMEVFFYIGIVFLLIGLGKLGFARINKEQKTKVRDIKPTQTVQANQMKVCPSCGLAQYAAFSDCVQCKYQFRKTY
jgi:hypothetical protein